MPTKVAALHLLLVALAGCPGSTADPCAAVTCAPGRTCVDGKCEQDQDVCTSTAECGSGQICSGGRCVATFADTGVQDLYVLPADLGDLPDGARLDGQTPAGDGPRDGLAPDTAPPPDTAPSPDLKPTPDLPVGQWYQANAKNCPTFCAGLGKTNTTSPEGARCISGEMRPASAVAAGIKFTYGCWSSCAPMTGTVNSSSDGNYCYTPNQKRDGDGTDLTVGCFCL